MLAIDTSVAIPLLIKPHPDHDEVIRWLGDQPLAVSGHALVETYSVLTRLPGDLRLAPHDAAELLADGFEPPLTLSPETAAAVVAMLSLQRITGGAVYDALVGLAAREHGLALATRDTRARPTYDILGVRTLMVA